MEIESNLRRLLEEVKSGRLEIESALDDLRSLPFESLGYATVDHHRSLRMGFPEVIFAPGKTPEQVRGIAERILARDKDILITRVERSVFELVSDLAEDLVYDEAGRIIYTKRERDTSGRGSILVVTAGTSDIPVAEEAAITAETLANPVERLYDVGVAGIHRLMGQKEKLISASVVIVVAGMEGALASVVGGLVDSPVIAVPTSIGYGASFNGLAALLGMLTSCASGVTVVNIDNGFGAGYSASLINRLSGNKNKV
ncbi:nickel pincer cofactor biosynthesis protein LarB [candidate division KSB1 bacterium]